MSLPGRAAGERERKSSDAGGAGVRAARQVRSTGEGTRGASSATASGTKSVKAASTAVLKFKTNFRNTIYDTLLRRGWKET